MQQRNRYPDFVDPVAIRDYRDAAEVMDKLGEKPEPAPVDTFDVHADGGLIYNPLFREAAENGALPAAGAARSGVLELDGVRLSYSLPEETTAYDLLPVVCRVESDRPLRDPVHVSVTGFEDGRSDARAYYDLNLPGRIDMDYEFLGYADGRFNQENHPVITGDFHDRQGKAYPPYETTAWIRSGVVCSTDITWFKFRYTNTGDTILDPEGNAAFLFEPFLYRRNAEGGYDRLTGLGNLFLRLFDYLYPGESGELILTFPNDYARLDPGEYKIELIGHARHERKEPDYGSTIWRGYAYTVSSFCFRVAEEPLMTEPLPVHKDRVDEQPDRNGWLRYYEEFQSAFATWRRPEADLAPQTLYIQTAPWAEKAVIKLILGDTMRMVKADIPLRVDSRPLRVAFNPRSRYVVRPDGTRYPLLLTQCMADMRANKHRGPDTASVIVNDLRDMREAGIYHLVSTMGFAYRADPAVNNGNIDTEAFRFAMDAARVMDFTLEDFASYPYEGAPREAAGYLHREISAASEAAAALGEHILRRYGDRIYRTEDGTLLLGTEDTRGWLRIDLRVRFALSAEEKRAYREWLRAIYQNIHALNKAYHASYASFEEIDPEREARVSEAEGYDYNVTWRTFREGSKALLDFDLFRTVWRAQQYEDTLRRMPCKTRMAVRTEGWAWMVSGICPQTANAHYRHAYHTQRRNALVAEILQSSNTVETHSDYLTLPYTATEVRRLTAKAVEQGAAPMHLPQFNHMREIALNDRYGDPTYSTEFQTGNAVRGVYLDTMCAVFPWWRATYEEGGAPGILWQDYLCDGYVTATQYKEMLFFKRKLDEALDSEEGRRWTRSAPSAPSCEDGVFSYDETFVRRAVGEIERHSLFRREKT